jgi:hypothetical protein
VFAARPNVVVYSAVDPKATEGGIGDNTLTLPVACWWRFAGKEDRVKVEWDTTDSDVKKQMQWRRFDPKKKITWKQSTLSRDGKTAQVVSFDIAVPVGNKVVVFRDQTLYPGKDPAIIQKQMDKTMINKLGLAAKELAGLSEISPQRDQTNVGTLSYNAIAEKFGTKPPSSPAVEVLDAGFFDALVNRENTEIK